MGCSGAGSLRRGHRCLGGWGPLWGPSHCLPHLQGPAGGCCFSLLYESKTFLLSKELWSDLRGSLARRTVSSDPSVHGLRATLVPEGSRNPSLRSVKGIRERAPRALPERGEGTSLLRPALGSRLCLTRPRSSAASAASSPGHLQPEGRSPACKV